VASALAGILILLSGFILGGLLWYLRDVRLRTRHPSRISDERLAFSFIVFAVVPLAVLILVAVVWLFAVIIGVS
jgi:nitrogen fixation/metabolism regulation signal transduction histidine kinase